MDFIKEVAQLVRYSIARTDRTLRLCLLLLCAAPAVAAVLYLYGVLLPSAMRP
ncbi:hypothetical protein KZZ52_33380 [Dactylosporangium sp. AC04546]|uniref:hypothetical protein n=1 Tax=Dactylosporangium sp. AC04546 TaxID=2862460 RepID=UPI001EDDAA45|nr:hypothetical protein [Dactylosporangium sp. AC04546]WVK78873.1 hypothetical protein KZZ52_33380 [Dactylosporangium sp. AC04546]